MKHGMILLGVVLALSGLSMLQSCQSTRWQDTGVIHGGVTR